MARSGSNPGSTGPGREGTGSDHGGTGNDSGLKGKGPKGGKDHGPGKDKP